MTTTIPSTGIVTPGVVDNGPTGVGLCREVEQLARIDRDVLGGPGVGESYDRPGVVEDRTSPLPDPNVMRTQVRRQHRNSRPCWAQGSSRWLGASPLHGPGPPRRR